MDNRHVPAPHEAHFEAWFLAEAALRMKARSLIADEVSHVRGLVGEEIWERLGDKGNLFGKHVAKNLPYFSLTFERLQGTRSLYRRRDDTQD
jgi:hypothetical protein